MIITQTPLRISFAGGGTDLAEYFSRREGLVVSAAIDKVAYVIVSARYDEKIYVNYSRKEIVEQVKDIHHELVREAMALVGIQNGIEVTLLSDIPSGGSGLGSSSSFTVGLLNAFHQYQGEQVGPGQLAEEACEIEINRCGKEIGKQDQYMAAFGGIASFRFGRDGKVHTDRIKLADSQLRDFSSNLFLFFTNQVRQSTDILCEQNRRTPENLGCLDRIKALAYQAREAIQSGDFDRLGPLFDENWKLKKTLAGNITNDCIDQMYAQAMEAGASGGKICGAGGGGFLLLYCPPARQPALLKAMREYRRMPVGLEPDGSKVIFNYRKPSWK